MNGILLAGLIFGLGTGIAILVDEGIAGLMRPFDLRGGQPTVAPKLRALWHLGYLVSCAAIGIGLVIQMTGV